MYGASFPAEVMGGDYFDYFPFREEDIGVAIGDVCGQPLLAHRAMKQGVIAAEVMAGSKSAAMPMPVSRTAKWSRTSGVRGWWLVVSLPIIFLA